MSRTISTTLTTGITLTAGDNPVSLTSTGRITDSSGYGILGSTLASGWTISNSGTIVENQAETGFGVYLKSFGTLEAFTNQAGGLITSVHNGVGMGDAGVVINQAGATIVSSDTGDASAIFIAGSGTVVNAGVLQAANTGIFLEGGGSITNSATGTISGISGVYVGAYGTFVGASGTVTNAGTIIGTDPTYGSVLFKSTTGTSRLIVDPGAVFTGDIISQAASTNVIELASGSSAGTLSGFNGSSITNFATLQFDTGADWTVTGTSSASGLGSLAITGFTVGDTIDLTGFVATSKTFASNALVLTNASNAHTTLHVQGSFTTSSFTIGTYGSTGTAITLEATPTPPVITGAAAGQTVNDNATKQPFSAVTITDSNTGSQAETATITLTNTGTIGTDADGTLSGTGLTKTSTGIYTISAASAGAITTALEALVFTPTEHQVAPGSTVTTGFTLAVTDTAAQTGTNTATTVIATAVNDPPTISGAAAGQALLDNATDHPFSTVTIADPDFGATATVTITLTASGSPSDANGTLSGTGLTKSGTGTYTLSSGSPGSVTAELDALLFTPTAGEVSLGNTVTTGMTLSVTDGIVGSPTRDTTTTVVTTAVARTLVYGQTIDVAGIVAASETVSAGVMTLFNSGTTAVGFINVGTSVSGGDFSLKSDGSGGTNVIEDTVFGTYTSGITLLTNPTTIAANGEATNTSSSGNAVSGPGGTTWTLVNQGLVSETAASGIGISFAQAGTISNASGGTITAAGDGVLLTGGGLVTNASGGVIAGLLAVYAKSVAATVINAGSINASADAGVQMAAGGHVTNQTGGTITGYSGVLGDNSPLTVVNAGSIGGNLTATNASGVVLFDGGTVTNQSGGRITGNYGVGVLALGTLVNAGTITGNATDAAGFYASGGGLVTNQSGGVITGFQGVRAKTTALTVQNAGSIGGNATATTAAGVYLAAGGTIINSAGATIYGGMGVDVLGGGTVVNAGTIQGASGTAAAAVSLVGSGRLIVDPGAVFIGAADGGGGSTLELASAASAGTLTATNFTNFSTIDFDAGAAWTLAGATTALSGAIVGFTYGDTIDLTGFQAANRTFGSNALVLGDGVGDYSTLQVQGTFATGNFVITNDGSGGTDINVQPDLIYDQTVDEAGIVAASETVTAGVMTLLNGGGTAVGTVAVGTSLSTGDFSLQSDGSGGTDIVVHTATGTYSSGVTLLVNPTTIASTATIGGASGSALYGPGGGSQSWTINNYGVINGGTNAYGIQLGNGGGLVTTGVITNQAGATIQGRYGIRIYNQSAVSIVNLAGATIAATGTNFDRAIDVETAAGTVTNAGLITALPTSRFNVGVELDGGGTVINSAGATIYGGMGVDVLGAGTVVNAGTIQGAYGTAADAVSLVGSGRLIVDPGAVFIGAADGGGSTLELASAASAGTLTATNFTNFSTIDFDAGAAWTLAGATTALSGTIVGFTFGDTIDLTGFQAANRTFGSNALVLGDGVGDYNTLQVQGTFATGNFVITNDGSGGTDISLQPVLIYGDTIDEAGTVAASETVTAGVMTLFNGGGTPVGTVVVGTSLSTGDFTLTPDGSSGTDVIVNTVFGTYSSGVTLLVNPTTIASTASVYGTVGATGVYGSAGTPWTVTNQGTVSETGGGSFGISFAGSGTITNAAGAVISGASDDVKVAGAGATVINLGQLSFVNGNSGVYLANGGVVTNGQAGTATSTASISGYQYGVYFKAGTGTVTNYGTVSGLPGGTGIELVTGLVVNGPGGETGALINAGGRDVVFGGAGTLVNYGRITGSGNPGYNYPTWAAVVDLTGAATISNLGSASLISAYYGVRVGAGSTVTNAGTIQGEIGALGTGTGGDAIIFEGGASRLIVDPGAVFISAVYGGSSGTSVIELASGASAGTLAGFGTTITNFGSLAFDPGAQWTVAGNDSASGLGTLGISGFTFGDTIDLTGFQAVSRTFTSNTLVLGDGVGDYETLQVQGTFATGNFAITNDGSGGTDINVQPDLLYGQTIDEAGIVAASETVAAGVMTLLNGGGTPVGTVVVGTSLSTGDFTLTPDGSSGTDVIVNTVFGTYSSGVTLLANPTTIASTGNASNAAAYGAAVTGPGGTTWTLTNQGLVSETAASGIGISFAQAGTITNASGGTIAAAGYGVLLTGGLVTNASGGVIAGLVAVYAKSVAATVINAGSINASADAGVQMAAGGQVTNQSGGTITGYSGVLGDNTPLTVVNAGSIGGNLTANSAEGVVLFSGGTVTNLAGGIITGNFGVTMTALGTLVNAGTIAGNFTATTAAGVYLAAGGSVTNQSGGTISGYSGVKATNDATVVNAGTIAGNYSSNYQNADGVYLSAGGTVTNQAGGVIYGRNDGILITGAGGTVVNLGSIHSHTAGYGGRGVSLAAGGLIINGASGGTASTAMIAGYNYAVQFGTTGTDTLNNYGTISGFPGTVAVSMYTGTLINGASGATGALIESGLQSNAVVISGAGTVVNYGSITGLAVNGEPHVSYGVSLGGSGSVASTISNLGANALISGYVAVYAAQNATVTNAGTMEATQEFGGTPPIEAVIFGGGTNRLIIDPGAVFIGGVNGSGAFTVAPGGNTTVLGTSNGIGTTTLELASGASAGTMTGLGVQYVGFAAVTVDSGAQWTFAGYNTLASGITLTNSGADTVTGTLANAGVITGAADGLFLGTGGLISNQSGGIISATGTNGVAVSGSGAGTLVNAGSISGGATAGAGVNLAGGGTVTNQSGGTIAGFEGIAASGTSATILNLGDITGSGTLGNGILLSAGGTVTNQSGGSITGINGIDAHGVATIINAGYIADTPGGFAVYLAAGGVITNQSGGTLAGSEGVFGGSYGSAGVSVLNAGLIEGTSSTGYGLNLNYGGSATNLAGGTITGGYFGVAASEAATLINAGDIAGTSGTGIGVSFGAGGTITNQSGGVISGATDAVTFASGYTNRLVIDPGASFVGTVDGGNTIGSSITSTLELASGASEGTLLGVGSQYINFGQITIDAGAQWDVVGSDATTALAGTTITGFTYGDTIDVTNFQATGSVFSGGHLTLTSGAGSATLDVSGSFITQQFRITNDGSGGTDITLGAAVLNYGDTINEAGVVASSETVNAGGTLTLFNSGDTAVGTIGVGTTLTSSDFQVTNDGTNSTVVVSTVFGTYTGGITLDVLNTTIAGTASVSNSLSAGIALNGPGGTAWTLTNNGQVSETASGRSYGIALSADSILTNAAGGVITGYYAGVGAAAGVTIVNAGTIRQTGAAGGEALSFSSTGSVYNSGLISGAFDGITANGVTIDNAGSILAAVQALHIQGVVLNGSTGSTSALISGSSVGVYVGGPSGTIVNYGSIVGGLGITAGTYGGVNAQTIIDAGTIIGSGGTAIALQSAANVVRLVPGSFDIQGTVDGGYGGALLDLASAATAGTLSGLGTQFIGFGQVSVDSSAQWTLSGTNSLASGVTLTDSGSATVTGTLVNDGVMTGSRFALDGGVLTNQAGGVLTATYIYGVAAGASDTVFNQGTVTNSAGAAIDLAAGGSISNAAGALISGYSDALKLGGASATVNNFGQIAATPEIASYGVYLSDGGLVINGQAGAGTSTAAIQGYGGIFFKNAAGTVGNYGTIIADGFQAVGLGSAGGSLVNGASGATAALIQGFAYGVSAGLGSVTNYGTIIATNEVTPTWGVDLDTTGTVANLGTASLIEGYNGVKIGTDGTLINAGTIESNQGAFGVAVDFVGGNARLIDNPGAVFVGSISGGTGGTAVLELASAASAGTIAGLGTSVTNFTSLVFDAGAQWTVAGNDSANGLGTLGISGFTIGDTIDLTGIDVTSRTFSSNALTLAYGAGSYATLAIQGSFSSANFVIASDGSGGTDITYQTVYPLVIAGTTPGQTVNDNATVQPFSSVAVIDPNAGDQSETATITVTAGGFPSDADGTLSGTGLTETGTGTYELTVGSAAAVTAALDALVFTPTPHQIAPGDTVTTGFTIAVTDTLGQSAADTTTTVTTTAVNDPPAITGTAANQAVNDDATAVPFAGVTVADPDLGASETVSITLTDGGSASDANGTLSGTGLTKTGTGTYTLTTGTPDAVTAALDAIVFTPTAHEVAPGVTIATGMTLAVSDGIVTSPVIDTTTSVVATAVNDPPAITGTTANQAVNDDATAVPFAGVTVADPDLGASETVSITLTDGGSASDANGTLSGTGLTKTGTGTYTLTTGTPDAVTAALDAIVFTPTAHEVAPGGTIATGMTLAVSDGIVTSPVIDTTTSVVATAVNDPPAITGTTANQLMSDDATAVPFAGVTVADPDLGASETVSITLTDGGSASDANGTLSGTGLTKTGTGTYTLTTGTPDAVTAALDAIVFTPTAHEVAPGVTIATGMTLAVSDGIVTSPVIDTTTSVVTTAVNDPPAITGTAANQAVNDDATAVPFAGVTVADPDLGASETVSITLTEGGSASDANGTLSGTGLTKTGTGTYTLTTGTPDAVTAALDAIVFTPTAHEVAPGVTIATGMTLAVSDGIVTSPVIDTTTSVVTTAVNDPPAITGTAANQAVNDDATAVPFAGVTVADPDLGASETVSITLTDGGSASDANGTLSGTGLTKTGTGTYTLTTGTPDAVTAALDAIVFTPAAHEVAPGVTIATGMTLAVSDGIVTSPVIDTTTSVVATAVNDPPAITGTTANQLMSDDATAVPFAGVTVADPDLGASETVSITLTDGGSASDANGTLSGTGLTKTGTGTYTLTTGTPDAVTAALDAIVFTPTAHEVAPGGTIATGMTLAVSDGIVTSPVIDTTTSVVATAVNDPPAITGTTANQLMSDDATAVPFAGVTVADPDLGASETVSITLTDGGSASDANGTLSGTGLTKTGTGTYTLTTGTPDAVTAALDAIVFTPTAHEVAPGVTIATGMTLAVSDGIVTSPVIDTTTSVVTTAVNDPPAITGTAANQAVNDDATAVPFAGVTVADPDLGASETVSITLTEGGSASDANGTLSGTGLTKTGTGTYTLTTGTPDAVTAALDAIVFTPTAHEVAPGVTIATGMTLAVSDGIVTSPVIDTTTSVVTTAVNDPPAITGTAANQAVNDDATAVPFAGVTVADPDLGASETVSITLTDGGSASDANGTLSGTGLTKTGTGTYTLTTGTPDAVTAALDAIVFTPAAHEVAPGVTIATGMTLAVSDGIVTSPVIDTTTSVVATAVNDPPAITGTAANQAVNDDATAVPFAGVTVADPDLGASETVSITLTEGGSASDANGTLSGTGLTKTGTGTYTLTTGTPDAVTAALDAIVFTPTAHEVAPGVTIATGMTLAVSDGIVTSPVIDTTTSVVATAVNDPPAITGTTANQLMSDDATAVPFAGVTVADPDLGASETVSITLTDGGSASDANGTLSGTGLTKTGTGTYTLTTGTPDAVTAALDAIVFTPTAHEVAPGGTIATGMTLAVSDGIVTSPVIDTTTSVVATAVNDPPAITGTTANQLMSDDATAVPFAGVTVADPDLGASETVSITLTDGGSASDANGTLSGTGLTKTGTGTYTLTTGTPDAVTAALDAIVFTPTAHEVAPGVTIATGMTLAVSDGIVTSPVIDTTTSVVTTAVNDPPAITGTAANQAVNDDATAVPFAGVTVADPDLGASETVSITLTEGGSASDANGTLSGTGLTKTGTGTYTLTTGTPDAVTAALDAIVFTPTAHEVAPGVTIATGMTLAVSDGIVTSPVIDTTTSVVTTAVNDPPAITGTAANQAVNDDATAVPFAGVTVADPDLGASETVSITLTDGGSASDANGTLSGTGLTKTGTGTYTLTTGTPDAVTAALDAIVFTPAAHEVAPGVTIATGMTLAVSDGIVTSPVIDTTTSVVATAVNDPPAITGTTANQLMSDDATAVPFAGVTVADPDLGASETVSITLTDGGSASDANGTLSGTGLTKTGTGTYTLTTGTPDAVTAALDAIVFTPAVFALAPSETITTGMTLAVSDGIVTSPVIDTTTAVEIVPCFAAGTRIATPRGAIAVERLREGDTLLTVSGKHRPIQWIGRRTLDCGRHISPDRVKPIRIAPHAFGENRPNRALVLSPDHSVFVEDVLIPVRHLVNGTTVTQIDARTVTYYHIELPTHDVVLAEGLPAETYLETGGRSAFGNGGGAMQLHPDFAPDEARVGMVWRNFGYAPLIGDDGQLDRVRGRLACQALMLGYRADGASQAKKRKHKTAVR